MHHEQNLVSVDQLVQVITDRFMSMEIHASMESHMCHLCKEGFLCKGDRIQHILDVHGKSHVPFVQGGFPL